MALSIVGWVDRSETHHPKPEGCCEIKIRSLFSGLKGFLGLINKRVKVA
jgi:hypothetical protein